MNFLFVDGLTSFQLPTQNTVVLENNGTVGKRINASSDHQPDQGSLGATWGGPKIVENPLTLDLHKRVKRAVRISKCNLWSFVNVVHIRNLSDWHNDGRCSLRFDFDSGFRYDCQDR